jgi:hypothetical protein
MAGSLETAAASPGYISARRLGKWGGMLRPSSKATLSPLLTNSSSVNAHPHRTSCWLISFVMDVVTGFFFFFFTIRVQAIIVGMSVPASHV